MTSKYYDDERIRAYLSQSPLSTQLLSPDGKTVFVNAAWERLWRITFSQLGDYNLLQDEQLEEKGVAPYIARAFAGESVQIPAIAYNPALTVPNAGYGDDPTRWVRGYAYPVRDQDDKIEAIVLMHEDITDQVKTESQLARYQMLVEHALDIVLFIDAGGKIVEANEAAIRAYGYTSEELRKIKIQDLRAEGTLKTIEMEMSAAMATGISFETVHRRKNGSLFPVAVSSRSSVVDGQALLLSIVRDISVHKEFEQELRFNEERYRSIVENMPTAVTLLGSKGDLLAINKAGLAMMEAGDPADVLGHPVLELIKTPDAEALQNLHKSILSGQPQDIEFEITGLKGGRRFMEARAVPLKATGGEVLQLAITQDVTEKRRGELALRESEERFRLALSNGVVTVFEQDQDLRYIWLFPYDPAFFESILGKTDAELLPVDEGEELTAIKRSVLETGQGTRRVIKATLPGEVRYYDLVVEPRFNESRQVIGVGGAALDITSQKLIEDALKETDRRKDEFLATLAHELRNPLAPINNGLNVLSTDTSPVIQQEAKELMRVQLKHMVRLVDDLLDVSRINTGKIALRMENLDVGEILQAVVQSTKAEIEKLGHELVLTVPSRPVLTKADPVRLSQIFFNLLTNAAKYTPKKGKILISLFQDKDEVVIEVADNGIGIEPEMLPHVFEMFAQADRTLGRSQGGLGIGLGLVKKLAELHGGTVTAASEGLGKGALFQVRLPCAETNNIDGVSHSPGTANSAKAQALRVLIVDDNQASAKTLGWAAEMFGHEVRLAYSSDEALEMADRFNPEVILLDIGLPGMNGYDLCRVLRKKPSLADALFVAQTGWGNAEHRKLSAEAGFDEHLVKPVDIEALEKILSDFSIKTK